MKSVEFDAAAKRLTVLIDFAPGTRFGVPGDAGPHPVHDTVAKDYRHLNFFQHECHLRVRTPRVKLPDGSVRLVEPEFAGRLSGFTLLFEALILMLAQQMPFAAVARIALVGNNDVIERALLGTAAGKANLDHDISLILLEFPARTPEKNRVGPREPRILADLRENESPASI